VVQRNSPDQQQLLRHPGAQVPDRRQVRDGVAVLDRVHEGPENDFREQALQSR
jgi:hypothetical protein